MDDQEINGASAPDAVPELPTEPVEESAASPLAESDQPIATAPRRRRRSVTRFLIAFMFGLLAVLTVSVGALAAYEILQRRTDPARCPCGIR